jgi:hypothetical protein
MLHSGSSGLACILGIILILGLFAFIVLLSYALSLLVLVDSLLLWILLVYYRYAFAFSALLFF